MSRRCDKCGYFNGRFCEAGVTNSGGGCDYHYETLARMKREQQAPPRTKGHWYTKNGNLLLYYCSECDSPSVRKTRYCSECGARKEDLC